MAHEQFEEAISAKIVQRCLDQLEVGKSVGRFTGRRLRLSILSGAREYQQPALVA